MHARVQSALLLPRAAGQTLPRHIIPAYDPTGGRLLLDGVMQPQLMLSDLSIIHHIVSSSPYQCVPTRMPAERCYLGAAHRSPWSRRLIAVLPPSMLKVLRPKRGPGAAGWPPAAQSGAALCETPPRAGVAGASALCHQRRRQHRLRQGG